MIWRQKHLVVDVLFDLVMYCLSLLLFYFCLCALMDVTCKTHVRFCVAGNLGQDALVKYFNLNVLFLVK